MRFNPYEFSNVSDDEILHPQPARITGCVTPLLACGFICISLATGLMHFVMAGLLAIPVIVVAFGLVTYLSARFPNWLTGCTPISTSKCRFKLRQNEESPKIQNGNKRSAGLQGYLGHSSFSTNWCVLMFESHWLLICE
jgi:hypothetical protein